MKIDKELLNEQMTTFHAQRDLALKNLGMVEGAIQAIQHLQNVLDMEEPPKEEIPEGKKGTLQPRKKPQPRERPKVPKH